jgi:hypothetical protein
MADMDTKQLVRLGAATRVAQIKTELAALYRAYPSLRGTGAAAGRAGAAAPVRRKKRKVSAAQREAARLRMTKYWAERKKAAAKK